mmetsp:Transcript_12889/g.38938  ORF Transcript_12889/g.38938 Transcript_12889/m.38938 type:complete len:125 (-) Transcript_12889:860-1234(-)
MQLASYVAAGAGLNGAQMTQPLKTLSGGQAVRVALAGIAMQAPHLLVLDEPSNHLDMDTVDALIEALQAYEGAVLLASHDQHLVSSVANTVFRIRAGKMRRLENGMQQYVDQLERQLDKLQAAL